MKQKKMLALTFSQLKQIYNQEIPEVVEIADKSSSVEEFKAGMLRFLEICRIENEAAEEAREQIRLLLDYDGQNVHELSTGQDMSVQTIRLLYEFLTGTLENMEIPTDLFIEIFQMFKRLKGEVVPLPSPQRIKSRNDRWETGLDEEVREVRDENKERMLHLLIQKIENRKSKPSVRFHFEEGMSYEEKYRLVNEWWNDFRFHLAMAVKSPGELNRFLGNSLSSETMYLLYRARKKGMPFFATPYYLSLLNVTGYGYNDEAIRSYILYSPRLVETYGNIRAWEKEDIVEAGKPNAGADAPPHPLHHRPAHCQAQRGPARDGGGAGGVPLPAGGVRLLRRRLRGGRRSYLWRLLRHYGGACGRPARRGGGGGFLRLRPAQAGSRCDSLRQ